MVELECKGWERRNFWQTIKYTSTNSIIGVSRKLKRIKLTTHSIVRKRGESTNEHDQQITNYSEVIMGRKFVYTQLIVVHKIIWSDYRSQSISSFQLQITWYKCFAKYMYLNNTNMYRYTTLKVRHDSKFSYNKLVNTICCELNWIIKKELFCLLIIGSTILQIITQTLLLSRSWFCNMLRCIKSLQQSA